jgi:addiction module HigA family antidote
MASDPTSSWQPDWAVSPGEVILEALQDRGMTQAELARRMARPPKTVNEIIKGKAAITAETAIQLERTLGISARLWAGLEANYRQQVARRDAMRNLETEVGWMDGFPLKDLRQNHLIHGRGVTAAVLDELLSFFGVSSPEAFERHWLDPQAAFRSSPAFVAQPKAMAAWLRWGQVEAAKVPAPPPFQAGRFRKVLGEVLPMTRRGPFMQILERVRQLCLSVGVIVVLTPEFQGTHVSGASHWVKGRPVIQLSLRHKSDDQFWFTFFHEAGHVLTSRQRRDYVDSADLASGVVVNADEAAANQYARDSLLSPAEYAAFVDAGDYCASSVRALAEVLRVAPGIVVGRLQRDGRIPRSHLNDLKRTIEWFTDLP